MEGSCGVFVKAGAKCRPTHHDGYLASYAIGTLEAIFPFFFLHAFKRNNTVTSYELLCSIFSFDSYFRKSLSTLLASLPLNLLCLFESTFSEEYRYSLYGELNE